MKGSSNLYEEMLQKKAELRKKLFPNLNTAESQKPAKNLSKLVCELAKAVKVHYMSVSAVNAILQILQPYHPGLPITVDKLLNTAETLKKSNDVEDFASEAEEDDDLEISNQVQHELLKGQKRLQTEFTSLENRLTLELAELKSLLGHVSDENRVKILKPEPQFIDKEDMQKIKLPLESVSDLERLETQLKLVEGATTEMEIYLNQLPVKPQYGHFATSMLKDLFSPNFMLECRWATKVELRNTILMQLIIAKVRDEFPSADETKIKDHIGQFLRKKAMLAAKALREQSEENEPEELEDENETSVHSNKGLKIKEDRFRVHFVPKPVKKAEKRPRLDDEDEEDEEYLNEEHLEMEELEESSSNSRKPSSQAYIVQAQSIPKSGSIELPVCSIKELENLETTLKHVEDAPNEFIEQLNFVVKHSTLGKYVSAICRSVFEQNFILNCRWFGIKSDQITLKHTICMRLVLSKVKQEFPDLEERKIIENIAQFFRSWGCHSIRTRMSKSLLPNRN